MKPLTGVNLKRFLRDYRREKPPGRDIIAMLQSVEYPYNVGAIFRLADGLGIGHLILTGITPIPPNPTIKKVGRSKDRNIPWIYDERPENQLSRVKDDGYHVVAIELVESAVPFFDYGYPDKVCLVVGHEDHGVTRATLAHCDAAVFIPMYGKGLSLNVGISLAIVASHIRYSSPILPP